MNRSAILFFVGASILCPLCHAGVICELDARDCLDKANIVCHGKVLSTYSPIFDGSLLHPGWRVARIQILNTIKGSAKGEIKVWFKAPKMDSIPTQIEKDKHYLLFLEKRWGDYYFFDDQNGAQETPPHEALSYDSSNSDGKFFEELIEAIKLDKGLIRLKCLKDLRRFPTDPSILLLKTFSQNLDMAVQGGAYASLIAMDIPPTAENLSRFFARQDNEPNSVKQFGADQYGNSHLKLNILQEMENRFCRIEQDYVSECSSAEYVAARNAAKVAAEKWKDFDLIGFLELAHWQQPDWGEEPEKYNYANAFVARILSHQVDEHGVPANVKHTYRKGSKPLILSLLNSPKGATLTEVVLEIDRMITEPHNFPYPHNHASPAESDVFAKACRLWLAGHKEWEGEKATSSKLEPKKSGGLPIIQIGETKAK